MTNFVRLGVEAVLVIVLIVALILYFGQQQQVNDEQTARANAESTNAVLAGQVTEQAGQLESAAGVLEDAEADAATAIAGQSMVAATRDAFVILADEQSNIALTAQAGLAGVMAQADQQHVELEAAQTAQAEAEAEAQANADALATAQAELEAAQTAQSEAESQAQANADALATAQAELELAGEQIINLQATIDALEAATPEPTATR